MRYVWMLILCSTLLAWEPKQRYCHTRAEVGAELIYWRAFAEGYAFEEGKLLKANSDFSFRVNGAMTSMDQINYTSISYLQFFSRDFFQGQDDLFELKYGYRTGEVQFGHDLLKGCEYNFTLFVGGRYAMIRRREVQVGVGDVNARYEGGGPEIGFSGAYWFSHGFNVVGQMSMATIIGVRNMKNFELRQPAQTTCVSAFRFRLGVSFTAAGCRCLDLIGEIGFEYDTYLQVLEIVDVIETGFATKKLNVAFGGPYAALWVRF